VTHYRETPTAARALPKTIKKLERAIDNNHQIARHYDKGNTAIAAQFAKVHRDRAIACEEKLERMVEEQERGE